MWKFMISPAEVLGHIASAITSLPLTLNRLQAAYTYINCSMVQVTN